jgi:hypothetical protein
MLLPKIAEQDFCRDRNSVWRSHALTDFRVADRLHRFLAHGGNEWSDLFFSRPMGSLSGKTAWVLPKCLHNLLERSSIVSSTATLLLDQLPGAYHGAGRESPHVSTIFRTSSLVTKKLKVYSFRFQQLTTG